MTLGLAAALFVVLAGGLTVLLYHASHKENKRRLIAGACVLGALLLALVVYIALTFLFLDAVSNESPPQGTTESAETAASMTTG